MLARLLFTEVMALGPVISTKFWSITSTITHFFPASRPEVLMHTLPISIAGNFNPLPFDYEYTCLYFTHVPNAKRCMNPLSVIQFFYKQLYRVE